MNQEQVQTAATILTVLASSALSYLYAKAKETNYWKKEIKEAYESLFHKDLTLSGRLKEMFTQTRLQTKGDRVWLLMAKNGSKYYSGQAIFKLDMVYESVDDGISSMQEHWQDRSTTLLLEEIRLAKQDGIFYSNLEDVPSSFLKSTMLHFGNKGVMLCPIFKLEDPAIEVKRIEPIAYVGITFRQIEDDHTQHILALKTLQEYAQIELSKVK